MRFHIRSLDNMRFHIRSLDNMRFHIRSLDDVRFHIRSLDNSSLSRQLSIDLADSISQTKQKESSSTTAPEATLQRVPQIQLCRDSFQQLGLPEQWTTNNFQETTCSSSLSTKALDSNNFQDGSMEEETFRQATSKTAAWQKRPSDRQLPRQQLGRRDLQTGNFSDSSLAEETFRQATSQTAAWKRKPSERQLQRQQLGRGDLQNGNFRDSSLEEETFNKAASTTAPWKKRPSASQLQRQQLAEENFAERSLNGTLPSQLGRQQLRNSAWNSPAFRQELRELTL